MVSLLILQYDNSDLHAFIHTVGDQLNHGILVFHDYAKIQEYVKTSGDQIIAIIANISLLPTSGAIFPKIPKIILTEGMPVDGSNLLRFDSVLDFVLNLKTHNHAYILTLIKRVISQESIQVLIAHREPYIRSLILSVLQKQGLEVHQASQLAQCKEIIQKHPSIKLILAGLELPQSIPGALLTWVRETRSKQDLALIGLADSNADGEAVRMLRLGANDVISVPPSLAEIQVRVAQNLALVNAFSEITELSRKDFLTGLYNRRHFYETAEKLFALMKRGKMRLAVAMLDIDNFKKVNDSLGHGAGDLAIVECARQLKKSLRETDVIARFGGEEFCVLLAGHEQVEHAQIVMERIIKRIAEQQMQFESHTFSITVSCGLAVTQTDQLDTMIQESDRLLYVAKTTGKNRVVV